MDKKNVRIMKSRIVVEDYTLGDNPELEGYLSVWNPVIKKVTDQLFHIDELEGSLILPGGLDIGLLSEFLSPEEYDFIIQENYYDEPSKSNFTCTNEPRNIYQEEALEYLQETSSLGQKMLCLPTGMGKTYCVIKYASMQNNKVMIFVDQASHMMKQWFNEFLFHTDIDKSLILPVVGMETIDTLLAVDKELPFEVYLVSHSTIRLLLNSDNGELKFNALMNKLGIGLKVFDEAHVEWINTNRLDSFSDTLETIYLTATPNRSDRNEDEVYQAIYETIPKFGLQYRDLEEERYQNLKIVHIDSNPEDEDIKSTNSIFGFNGNVYSDYLLEKRFDYISDVVVDILDELKSNQCEKVAIICHKNNFIQHLYEDLKARGISENIGRFSGLVDSEDKSKELDNDIIISTNRSLDKAIDIKGLDGVICLTQYSSKVVARQLVGRIRNPFDDSKEVYYYDVTDFGFPKCRRQLKLREPAITSKAKDIEIVDYT